MTNKPPLIQSPRRLGDKVPATGGPTPEQAIRKALNLGNELARSYKGWAVDDLQALWEEHETLSTDPERAPECVAKMYDMAHEIRGQGGSFGYPMITLIADSLCKFMDGSANMAERGRNIVQLHLLAMKAVLRQDMKGPQKAFEQDLSNLLAMLRERR
jgi:hypothetical protein